MEKEKQVKKRTSPVTWLVLIVFVIIVAVVIDTASDAEQRVVQNTINISNECLSVPEVIVERLNSGLNINGGGSIRNVKAVKSKDFESVYFVSGDLQGAGLEGSNDIATYATNKLDYTGMTLSVDAVAVDFSDWPDVKTTNLEVAMSNHGYSESRRCVTEAL